MPFEMLFDRDHKVLLVRFVRALTRQALESIVQAAREFVGVHGIATASSISAPSRRSISTLPIFAPTAAARA